MDDFLSEFLDPGVLRSLLPGLLTEGVRNTVVLTALGFTGGVTVGLPVALMRQSRRRCLRWPAVAFTDLLRGLPALLVVVFIGFGIPIATGWQFPAPRYLPGSLALSLVAGAYIAETFRAGLEGVPRGQLEAARALGMGERIVLRHVVLPQALRLIAPPLTNELVLLFKDTSLLAILGTTEGGKEILKFARDAANRTANTTPLVAAGLAYLAITLPLVALVRRLERRLARPSGGRAGGPPRAIAPTGEASAILHRDMP